MVLDRQLCFLFAAALSCSCIQVACGGSKPTGAPDPVPTAASGVASRLAWSQAASSTQQLQALTFRLYVDRALSTLTSVNCDTRTNSGPYECSGQLPNISGTRMLEVSAVLNGVEGPRSAPLTVTISSTVGESSPAE